MSSFSPRQEGSAAEGALLDWIAARVSAEGIRAVPFDFRHSNFEHSFSRCLRVDVPGRSKDTLIVAVPVDAAPDAGPAQDGSIGVALALDLLDNLKGSRPPLSLIVLFVSVLFLTWAQITRSALRWVWLGAGVLVALGVGAGYLLAGMAGALGL